MVLPFVVRLVLRTRSTSGCPRREPRSRSAARTCRSTTRVGCMAQDQEPAFAFGGRDPVALRAVGGLLRTECDRDRAVVDEQTSDCELSVGVRPSVVLIPTG